MAVFSTVQNEDVVAAARWDAEFFVTEYKAYLSHIFSRWTHWVPLRAAARKLTSGHTPLRHDVDTGDSVFLTVECIDPLGIDFTKAKRIFASQIEGELQRVKLAQNDVLITIKRRIVNSCPILEPCPLMAVNQDVAVMTPKEGFLPSFVSAVLVSRVGKYQAFRCQTEQMNPYLSVTALGQLQIPILPAPLQRRVDAVVRERVNCLRESEMLYHEAQAEMLDRLEWVKLAKRERELVYVEDYGRAADAERCDAEHFQPQYRRLQAHLLDNGAMRLGEVCLPPSRGVQPEYAEDGPVAVVSSRHLGPTQIDTANLEHTTAGFYNSDDASKARLTKLDVLLYSTGAYVGRTNVWLDDGPALASNHVTIIRPEPRKCHPIYLALFLNSAPGLMQSAQYASGSAQQELYASQICKFLVYVPTKVDGKIDLTWQERLAAKLLAAREANSRALAKLQEAKALIEQEIEKGSA